MIEITPGMILKHKYNPHLFLVLDLWNPPTGYYTYQIMDWMTGEITNICLADMSYCRLGGDFSVMEIE